MPDRILLEDTVTISCVEDPTQRLLNSFQINLKIRTSLSDACTIANEELDISDDVPLGLCLENSLDSFEINTDFESRDDSGNIKVNIQIKLVSPLELPSGNTITWVYPITLEHKIIPDIDYILEKYEGVCGMDSLTKCIKVDRI